VASFRFDEGRAYDKGKDSLFLISYVLICVPGIGRAQSWPGKDVYREINTIGYGPTRAKEKFEKLLVPKAIDALLPSMPDEIRGKVESRLNGSMKWEIAEVSNEVEVAAYQPFQTWLWGTKNYCKFVFNSRHSNKENAAHEVGHYFHHLLLLDGYLSFFYHPRGEGHVLGSKGAFNNLIEEPAFLSQYYLEGFIGGRETLPEQGNFLLECAKEKQPVYVNSPEKDNFLDLEGFGVALMASMIRTDTKITNFKKELTDVPVFAPEISREVLFQEMWRMIAKGTKNIGELQNDLIALVEKYNGAGKEALSAMWQPLGASYNLKCRFVDTAQNPLPDLKARSFVTVSGREYILPESSSASNGDGELKIEEVYPGDSSLRVFYQRAGKKEFVDIQNIVHIDWAHPTNQEVIITDAIKVDFGPDIDLMIEGPDKAEVGAEISFKATIKAQNPADLIWLNRVPILWLLDDASVGRGPNWRHAFPAAGYYRLTAQAVLDGRVLGEATRVIAVENKPADSGLKITAPSEIMLSDIFDVAVDVAPEIMKRAKIFLWRGGVLIGENEWGKTSDSKTKMQFTSFAEFHAADQKDRSSIREISVSVDDEKGNQLGYGEKNIIVKPASFSGSASDIWEGDNYLGGISLKRKELKGPVHTIYRCDNPSYQGSSGVVYASLGARFVSEADRPDDFSSVEDIAAYLNEQTKDKAQAVKAVSLGDFKGYLLETDVSYKAGGGDCWMGLRSDSTSGGGRGFVMKGRAVIALNYNVGGSGQFNHSDRAWLESMTKAVRDEALGILLGLRIESDGKFKKNLYDGPKLDGSDWAKLALAPDKLEKVRVGDVVNIQAVVSNTKPEDLPLKYTWTGDFEGIDDTVRIHPAKPGKYTLSVAVDGAKYAIGSASLDYVVEDFQVRIDRVPSEKTPIPVGGNVKFKATLLSGGKPAQGDYVLRWQPHPEVAFSELDSPSRETTATFSKTGKVGVWVQVLEKRGGTLATVGESEQMEIEVIKPKLGLKANPAEPYVGQEVKIVLTDEPKMDDKTVSFWWEIAGQALNPGALANNREYTFKPKDPNPVTVTVHAKAKDGGEELGQEKITVTAKTYEVGITGPKLEGPAPMIWKEKIGLVPVERAIYEGQRISFGAEIKPQVNLEKIRYRWAVSPAGCVLGQAISRELSLTCGPVGSYTATVEVRTDEGAVLGSASASFAVTISQAAIADSQKKAEEEKTKQKTQEETRNNLALGKPAIQSSTSWAGEAKRAVDGSTDGDFHHNSVSHTSSQPQEWWQVDLGDVFSLQQIRIWNRTDCCGERLSNFYVLVSDDPFPSTNLQETLDQPEVGRYYFKGTVARNTDIEIARTGRHVRVQLAGTDYLALAEVEVIGSEAVVALKSTAGVNLAKGKTATQSSTMFGGEARRAVDGKTEGNFHLNFVSHTSSQFQAWWQVDLGAVSSIQRIRIWNRTDCCGERLSNFYVLVSDVPFKSTNLQATLNQPNVNGYSVKSRAGRPTEIKISRTGRYVRVQLAGANYLSLAEMEVIGSILK